MTTKHNSKKSLQTTDKHVQRLQALLRDTEDAQDRERQRLAREMHDSLCQLLTAFQMDFFWLQQKLPADRTDLQEKAQTMSGRLDAIQQSTRNLLRQVRPPALDDLGLLPAIEALVQRIQEQGLLSVSLNLQQNIPELPSKDARSLYRLVEDAVHIFSAISGKKMVKISLKSVRQTLILSFVEDRKGMSARSAEEMHHARLFSMQERARGLHGSLVFDVSKAGGIEIQVRIPVKGNQG